MPKRVDHEQRRREITEAVWDIAVAEGLPAVTLRRVAAQAGVSMNLVQYYFRTKDEMVRYGLQRVIEVAVARMREALTSAGRDPVAVVRACLTGMLPLDDTSRRTTAIYHAYLSYSATNPEIAALTRDIPRDLAARLEAVLPGARRELDSLIAMTAGLATWILVGSCTAEEAVALVDFRLAALMEAT